ncbi:nicotinate-nucleotide--dimethylbenzimidazole phosphoribosyltransferase [Methylomonas sp. AM2-LC]|uniref:nicotinate-nucleotide--dimethylbenzimidazole phosphoribosyltransferase n=1 Tax=Methylomonas sp. AM2-LC TaxID=3153301 RepID=UPI003266C818
MFTIASLDSALKTALLDKINNKTKPLGSLGQLETLALQLGLIQNTLSPTLNQPVMMVFAGDHGIVEAGVSAYPQAVTQQMVGNFLQGGAGINVFAKLNGMQVRIVDSGVNYVFPAHPKLINAKIGMGTSNFLTKPAMSLTQCELALQQGAILAQAEIAAGSQVLGFGEMGIGNTTSAAALMAILTSLPVSHCTGRGTGLDNAGLQKKTTIITQAIKQHSIDANDYVRVLATFGGFEIAMMAGAMLGAAAKKTVILIDGFIASAALLVATKMQANLLDYCVFAHCSDEAGHRLLLDYLHAKPLLNLGLRLGEGTGAALALPLLQAAISFLNDMASFDAAQVSRGLNSA